MLIFTFIQKYVSALLINRFFFLASKYRLVTTVYACTREAALFSPFFNRIHAGIDCRSVCWRHSRVQIALKYWMVLLAAYCSSSSSLECSRGDGGRFVLVHYCRSFSASVCAQVRVAKTSKETAAAWCRWEFIVCAFSRLHDARAQKLSKSSSMSA